MVFTYGSDFTGMNAPALAMMQLGVKFTHSFSCDNATPVQKFLKAVMPPEHMLTDVVKRDTSPPTVDYYHFSPPCVSLSLEGKRSEGANGRDPRDLLFRGPLKVIREQKPTLVTMEQVPQIRCEKHAWMLREIKATLDSHGYTSCASTLNCAHPNCAESLSCLTDRIWVRHRPEPKADIKTIVIS